MTDLLLLQAKTPAEIDAVLNDLGYQLAVVRSRAEQFAKLAQESAEGRRHQRPDPVKAKFYEEQAEQQRAKAQDLAAESHRWRPSMYAAAAGPARSWCKTTGAMSIALPAVVRAMRRRATPG